MKKVICAAAAFAMVAGVATVASAEVKLSGDARARWVYNDGPVLDSADVMDSRVRVVVAAKNEGGGYIKARLRFLDGAWGQGYEYTSLAKGTNNVWSDYAFLGFKKGNVDVAAGKMPIGFSPWFVDDERADRFRVRYNIAKGCFVAVTYDKKFNNGGFTDDKNVWGVTYKGKFSDTFGMKARAVYVEDGVTRYAPNGETFDTSGFKGSINFTVGLAGSNLIFEQSYKDGDTIGLNRDDQYGGYVEWNATYDAFTPVVRLGYTADGFSADETFGWLMIGGDEPISKIKRVGLGGDTLFAGASAKMAPSENLDFQGNLVFMDIDGGGLFGENPIEISGQTNYYLSKGVTLTAKAGWLSNDADGDDGFGAYGRMEVTF